MAATRSAKSPKNIASTQSLGSFVKSICDVMRRSNCASALQYVPELTWILFLRILDAQEARAREEAEVLGAEFSPALHSPYRWQDWAAPYSDKPGHPKTDPEHNNPPKPFGWKRQELFAAGDGKLFEFINKELLPHLHSLDIDTRTGLPNPHASRKQRIMGRTMTAVEKVRVDSEANLRDILDKVHQINIDHVDDQHFFTLSQVYEDLLLKMGEKNSDGGQFFTPREVIRAMVHTVNPQLGQTVYDPCCGTGGFLAIAYEHIARQLGPSATHAGKPFPSYARMLQQRGKPEGESRYSWTVDFAARRASARAEMQPLLDEAAQIKASVVDLKEKLKRLKKDKASDAELQVLDLQIKEKDKAARDLETQAADIDAAVFDMKAVNPTAVVDVDTRTPQQIIDNIEAQGRIVSGALARLAALMKTAD